MRKIQFSFFISAGFKKLASFMNVSFQCHYPFWEAMLQMRTLWNLGTFYFIGSGFVIWILLF
jgi:hypothetical protein